MTEEYINEYTNIGCVGMLRSVALKINLLESALAHLAPAPGFYHIGLVISSLMAFISEF